MLTFVYSITNMRPAEAEQGIPENVLVLFFVPVQSSFVSGNSANPSPNNLLPSRSAVK